MDLPTLTDAEFWELAWGAERVERARDLFQRTSQEQQTRMKRLEIPSDKAFGLNYETKQLQVVDAGPAA